MAEDLPARGAGAERVYESWRSSSGAIAKCTECRPSCCSALPQASRIAARGSNALRALASAHKVARDAGHVLTLVAAGFQVQRCRHSLVGTHAGHTARSVWTAADDLV